MRKKLIINLQLAQPTIDYAINVSFVFMFEMYIIVFYLIKVILCN